MQGGSSKPFAARNVDSDFSDISIVGGGVVGLALASSLASNASFQSSVSKLTLIEGSSLDKARQWAKTKQDGSKGPISDWENRVIYLAEENRQWLEDMGVTPYLVSSRLGPVHSMVVTDGVSGAALNFDVPTPASQRMGTMIEISNLQQALLRHVEAIKSAKGVKVQIIDSSRVEAIEADGEADGPSGMHADSWPLVRHSASQIPLKSRLLIGADGSNSPVRSYAGIKASGWDYGRMGVVATMRVRGEDIEERTAYQRFLPTGTIAWLPLSNSRASLVWTLPPDMAKAINAMQKTVESNEASGTSTLSQLVNAAFCLPWTRVEAILAEILACSKVDTPNYGIVANRIQDELIAHSADLSGVGQTPPSVDGIDEKSVAAFPLKLSHAECYLGSSKLKTTFADSGAGALQPSALLERIVKATSSLPDVEDKLVRGRTALIGDAAHTIHPLAGQGLNLGLADSKSLSAALIKAIERGEDLGSHVSLSSYPRDRYLANQVMLSAVDHLHWLFAKAPPGDRRNGLLGNAWSQALVWGRSTGFEVLNELGSVKRALMGVAGSQKQR